MRVSIFVTAVLLALAASLATAATSDVPRFGFLLIEPGGRPGGIGKSFTGLADDVHAAYYNPGGIALLERNAVSIMHEPRGTDTVGDIFYDYVAFSYGAGKFGTFGLDIVYSDAGKSKIVDEYNNDLGYMHVYGAAPSLYWSYPLRHDLGLGAGMTYAYEHLTDAQGGTEGALLFNVGALYQTPLKGLSCGAALVKLGGNEDASRYSEIENSDVDVSFAPPRSARLGVAYNFLQSDLNDLTVVADGSKLLMNLGDGAGEELAQGVYSGGLEYVYAKMIAVRGGYYYDEYGEIDGMTLGFGFDYKGLSFDYGRVPEGELFGDRNRFAVGYAF
jgi:long-subunit fatty acid transport protein